MTGRGDRFDSAAAERALDRKVSAVASVCVSRRSPTPVQEPQPSAIFSAVASAWKSTRITFGLPEHFLPDRPLPSERAIDRLHVDPAGYTPTFPFLGKVVD